MAMKIIIPEIRSSTHLSEILDNVKNDALLLHKHYKPGNNGIGKIGQYFISIIPDTDTSNLKFEDEITTNVQEINIDPSLTCRVEILNIPLNAHKLAILREIKFYTGLGLRESKDIMDHPCPTYTCYMKPDKAKQLQYTLKSYGVTCNVIN